MLIAELSSTKSRGVARHHFDAYYGYYLEDILIWWPPIFRLPGG